MGRAAALLALLGGLIGWYEASPHVAPWSRWPTILLIAFVVMPIAFAMVWLALPLWRRRFLWLGALAFVVLAVVLTKVHYAIGATFAKLAACTLAGWWFLGYFEAVSWVVLVAVVIPWVDAYSVWRGPTKTLTSGKHEHVFKTLSVFFLGPGERGAELGLPDLLFFAVFLGASERFRLRTGWTFVGLVVALALTIVLAEWWDVSGLPALPGIALGFLVPNADLLWRRLRGGRALEQ